MTTSRQPKGIPVGGQFAATIHAEPETGLYPAGSIGDRLSAVNAALAVHNARRDAEIDRICREDAERREQRARLAGVRSASLLLQHLPEADVLSYTRTPVTGTTALDEIRDVNNNTIYTADDLDSPVARGRSYEEAERRAAVREAVRLLGGATQPPEHEAQGITVHSNHERLHLPTALDDGLAVLESKELTPQQASTQRVESALSQWNDPDDAQTRVRDMLTDLRHYAAANDINLGQALDRSYEVFLEEHNDPAFTEGF